MKVLLTLFLGVFLWHASACDITVSHYELVTDFRISVLLDEASWVAFGREWKVHLSLTNIFDGNLEHFHGSLEGDADAVVSLSVLAYVNGTFKVHAMIILANDTLWLAPSFNGSFDLVMYKQSDIIHNGTDCVVPLSEPISADVPSERRSGEPRTVTSYKVAVFVDQNWANNNPWASTNDIYSLFNDVNAVYSAAGVGTFQVQTFGTIDNNGLTTTIQLLPYFSSHQAGFDNSFTNSIWLVGSNVGGLAYMLSTCKGQGAGQKTAVAGLTRSNRLWTVKTIAHELGHNRGAYHDFTDQCQGAGPAGCQCSLMSYCFPSAISPTGARNYFSQTSINQMRSAGCL